MIAPSYYAVGYGPQRKAQLARILEVLDALKPDAVAICGGSGATFGYSVHDATGLPLLVVPKRNEIGADGRRARIMDGADHKGTYAFKRWVFLDDLVASGDTYQHTFKWLRGHVTGHAAALVLFDASGGYFRKVPGDPPADVPVVGVALWAGDAWKSDVDKVLKQEVP